MCKKKRFRVFAPKKTAQQIPDHDLIRKEQENYHKTITTNENKKNKQAYKTYSKPKKYDKAEVLEGLAQIEKLIKVCKVHANRSDLKYLGIHLHKTISKAFEIKNGL